MKAEINNAKDFYKLLNFISQWQTEIRLIYTPENLSIVTVSHCSTVFIETVLPSSYFNLYQCEIQQPIGLNLNVVLAALKQSTTKDKLRISATDPKLDVDGSILESADIIPTYIFIINKHHGKRAWFPVSERVYKH